MKNFIVLMVFISTVFGFSQTVDENLYGYKQVIQVKEKSVKEIHSLLEEWIGNNFDAKNNPIQFNEQDKIVVKYEFQLNPRIMRTFQNTTTKYIANGLITFWIKDERFRVDMKVDDLYSFDGKKSNPNSTIEILKGEVDEEFIKIILSKGFMDVKQYGGFLSSLKTGDKKAKQAEKYVAKELSKGNYLTRVKKLSIDLNDEVSLVYSSINNFLKKSTDNDF